jgi:hypothetical protein
MLDRWLGNEVGYINVKKQKGVAKHRWSLMILDMDSAV